MAEVVAMNGEVVEDPEEEAEAVVVHGGVTEADEVDLQFQLLKSLNYFQAETPTAMYEVALKTGIALAVAMADLEVLFPPRPLATRTTMMDLAIWALAMEDLAADLK